MTSDVHIANIDRIESDYANLQVAFDMAQNYLNKCREDNVCFAALMTAIVRSMEVISQHGDRLDQDVRWHMIDEEQALEAASQDIAEHLIRMFYVGFEMGKVNHPVWTHRVTEEDSEVVVEAEGILRRLR